MRREAQYALCLQRRTKAFTACGRRHLMHRRATDEENQKPGIKSAGTKSYLEQCYLKPAP